MKNKQNITIGILVVVVVLLVGYMYGSGFIGSKFSGNSHMMGRSMADSGDRHFIEQMIPHHEGAIVMAQLALEKGKRSEVKTLATGIIEAQKSEIVEMKKWYQNWFGTSVPVANQHMMDSGSMGGSMHMNGMSGDMKALESAQDFDLEFVKQMIPHHEMAVVMAQMLKSNTTRAEMKQLADNIITSQTREIEMMRSWVTAWSNQ